MKICNKCGRNEDEVVFANKQWLIKRNVEWCMECFTLDRQRFNEQRKIARSTSEGKEKLLIERQKYKEYQKDYNVKYYQENKDSIKQQSLEWSKNNPEKKKEQRIRHNKKQQNNPIHNFHSRIRKRLLRVLNNVGLKKESRTQEMLGYSAQELYDYLIKYIDRTCEECDLVIITKNNSHIDHIIPIGSAKTKNDIINLNQLNNLRLICSTCNRKKATQDKQYIKNIINQ